jgi:hypothetical protein
MSATISARQYKVVRRDGQQSKLLKAVAANPEKVFFFAERFAVFWDLVEWVILLRREPPPPDRRSGPDQKSGCPSFFLDEPFGLSSDALETQTVAVSAPRLSRMPCD